MKFITKLRQDLKEYLFEIFEINKVFNQLDDISYRVEDVESDVRDLNHCDILNYGPEDFVESGELDDIRHDLDDIRQDLDDIRQDLDNIQSYDLDEMDIAIDKLSNSVEDLQEEVKSYRFEQVKLRRAMRALCMSLGRDDILNILEASEDE